MSFLYPRSSGGVVISRLERKLDAILVALNIDPATIATEVPKARTLAQQGDKIGAIKIYRQQTGATLAEAKAYVDSIR